MTSTLLALALHDPADRPRRLVDDAGLTIAVRADAHAAGLTAEQTDTAVSYALHARCAEVLQLAAATGRTDALLAYARPLLPTHPSSVGTLGPILDRALDGRDPAYHPYRDRRRAEDRRLHALRELRQ